MTAYLVRQELAKLLDEADDRWQHGVGASGYDPNGPPFWLADAILESEWYRRVREENTPSNETHYFQETKMTTITETTTPDTTKIRTVKRVARLVVNTTVTGTAVSLIAQNVAVESKTDKVKLYIGATLIGMMLAEQARDYVETIIDETAETIQVWKDARAEAKAENAKTTD